MSTEPTTEMMNEAICEFMGGHRMISGTIHVYKGPDEIEWETGKYLKYHTSWDWLMPVWKKAAKILYEIRNQLSKDDYLEAHKVTKSFIDACQKVEIDKAHDAVYRGILGITWYNDNQQKQNNGQ